MPLHLRKRGSVYHVRGTIRTGTEIVQVPEFSTGCRSLVDARAVAEAHEAKARAAAIDRTAGRPGELVFDDCFASYLQRPGGVKRHDADRVRDFSDRIGGRRIADAAAAWSDWLADRGRAMAPATVMRWRATLQAALGAGCTAAGLPATPRLPAVKQVLQERVVYLTAVERGRLLEAYNPAAGRVALVLAFQGLRTQEALRLDWRAVSLSMGTLRVVISKSGRGRTVPLHPRVVAMLAELYERSGRSDAGPVFLSTRGRPYSDTRETGTGGNPLTKAHATACKRACISGFRVHDWRHDFAVRFLEAGGDVRQLMQICGWSTIRMIERYVTFRVEHMRSAIERIA
jgi:integrase